MREHAHGKDFDLEGEFPHRRELTGWEGSGIWEAERDGQFFVIIDERRFADGLDPSDPQEREVLERLVRVMEFESDDERRAWMRLQLGS